VCAVLKELCKKEVVSEDQLLPQYTRLCLALSEMFHKVYMLFELWLWPNSHTQTKDGIVDQLDVDSVLAMVDLRPEDIRIKEVKETQKAGKGTQATAIGSEFVLLDCY
jgi:hypothetical protein